MAVPALERRMQPLKLPLPDDVSVHLIQIGESSQSDRLPFSDQNSVPSPDTTATRAALQQTLSRSEREKLESFARPALRRRYLYTRAALRQLLCARLDTQPSQLAIQQTQYGKPFLPDTNVAFNVSHSGDLALVAIGGARWHVGIDIERIIPLSDLRLLARRVLTPHELSTLSSDKTLAADKRRGFFRYWTCKEAYLKAIGTGLQTDMSHIEIELNSEHGEPTRHRYRKLPAELPQGHPEHSLEFTPSSGYQAAIVLINAQL